MGRPGRPALCFLHGGSAHAHWFDAVVPAFAGRYHVLSLDQRGHGASEWAPEPAYATEDFAWDLLGRDGRPGLGADGRGRALHGRAQRDGLRGLASASGIGGWPSSTAGRRSRPSASTPCTAAGIAGPRHETFDAALESFRLLPPETMADPALLAHLGPQGIAERDGRFLYRFDPACKRRAPARRRWPLLERITAPTLLVRGEHSPILPLPMAADMLKRLPQARLVEIAGAYHHLVLDAPLPFAAGCWMRSSGEAELGPA